MTDGMPIIDKVNLNILYGRFADYCRNDIEMVRRLDANAQRQKFNRKLIEREMSRRGHFPHMFDVSNHDVDEVREWCDIFLQDDHDACPVFQFNYPKTCLFDPDESSFGMIVLYKVWLTSERDVVQFKLRWHGPS